MTESLEREDLTVFLFCFLLSLFSFITCTNLWASEGWWIPNQDTTWSLHRVRRTAGVSWLRMPRQCFPSFGSSMDSYCFLWWLVGFGVSFFKFHSSQLSQREQLWSSELLGAPDHSSQQQWCCSGFTLVLPISLHACVLLSVGLKATSQGRVELLSHSFPSKAEVEGVPFPPKVGAQLKASATFISERATERKGCTRPRSSGDTFLGNSLWPGWKTLSHVRMELVRKPHLFFQNECSLAPPFRSRQGPEGACERFSVLFSKCLPALVSSWIWKR